MKNKTKTKILFLVMFLFTFSFISYGKILTLASNFDAVITINGASKVTIRWATPEKRAGPSETNDDTTFFLTFKNPLTHEPVFTTDLYNTANDGTYLSPITVSPNINNGAYDTGFKGESHLTKILRNINFTSGVTNLNFTQNDNSVAKGPIRLIAGDINGAGTTPATMGDDVINAVDLSAIISDLDMDDPTGNLIRANLNQDSVVNAVDLSLMVSNLDKEGDK